MEIYRDTDTGGSVDIDHLLARGWLKLEAAISIEKLSSASNQQEVVNSEAASLGQQTSGEDS